MATVTDFASSAGSSVLGSLVPTAAQFDTTQGTAGLITLSGVQFGLIKYTFSGSPTLTSVAPGHRFTATGFTNNENNVTNYVIYSVDNSAKTITVLHADRTTASLDETGITGTGAVTSGGASRLSPSDASILLGFVSDEIPSAETWNWLIYEMNQIITSVNSRAANVYAGPSSFSSSTYADLDGAGIAFGYAAVGSNQSWTASANDGAFESFTGLNIDPVIKGSNKVLHIATYEQNASISRPVELQLDIDSTIQYTFNTNVDGLAVTTQQKFSHSFANVSTSSAGAHDFNTEAKRYTGLGAVNGRSWAIELPPTDQSSNALVRFAANGITQAAFNNGSYADMTGYTTGSQTFNSGNKALILAGVPIDTSAATNTVRFNVKLLRDATDIFEYDGDNDGSFNNSSYSFNTGTMATFGWVDSVTGAHTYKLQGYYDSAGGSAAADYSGDDGGYFHVIELPAQWDGDTLVRAIDTEATFQIITTAAGFVEVGTSGAVTTNGHPVLLMLHLAAFGGGSTAEANIQFKLDGSAEGPVYDLNLPDLLKPVTLLWVVPAPAAGSHTFSVEIDATNDTVNYFYSQFAALEMPITADDAGNAPTVTLTDTTGKKVEITYTGTLTSSNAELGLQITENIDGGGAVADGNEFLFTPQASNETPFTFRTVVNAPTAGSTAVYKLQGKIASGTANISAGDFMAREIANDGT